ncbi:MAG: hypothetical protein ACHP7N_15835 [Caulobacterales bacterium]
MGEVTLEGQDGSLRLSVLRYQYPEIEDDEWDSNWLVVEGRVSLNGKEWRFCDPCMTTLEAMQLADWLDALSQGTAERDYAAFTEPNLQFDRTSASNIRVSFALESAPPWAKPGDDWTKHGFEVFIGPGLAVAAQQLRRQLARYPMRGGRVGGADRAR